MKISFLGDIMCYRKANAARHSSALSFLRPILKQSDYVIGNLETPISRKFYSSTFSEGDYQFVAPVEFAKALKDAGVTHVSVVNNHCLDQGFEGLMETILSVQSVGLHAIGAALNPGEPKFAILEHGDIRAAIISSTYGTNTLVNGCYLNRQQMSMLNLSQNQELSHPFSRILFSKFKRAYRVWKRLTNKEAEDWFDRRECSLFRRKALAKEFAEAKRAKSDFIIAYPHWGGQHRREPMQSVRELARFLFREGANCIVGNHEHLVQRTEMDKQRLCAYCLGNSLSYLGLCDGQDDKMENYSIMLHLYLTRSSSRELSARYTFSVLKCVPDSDGHPESHLLCDLIREEKDSQKKRRLLQDLSIIYERFTGRCWKGDDAQVEYNLVQEQPIDD